MCWPESTYGYIPQPAVCLDGSGRGSVLAAAGPGYDFNTGNLVDETTLFNYVVSNAAGHAATLTGRTTFSVPSYSAALDPTQPDGSDNLDDGDARFSAMVYEVGGVLYAVHNTEVNNLAAIRWYRINAADHSVLESGTITDPVLDLFYPSIAANASGTLAICFNGSSSNSFVSAYAEVGLTVNGVTSFGNRLLLKSGTASYQDQPGVDPTTYVSRWGDYSSTCVDPADPNRFWTIQMYPSGSSRWSTQITELRTAVPTLSIASTATSVTLSWPGTAVPFNLLSNTNLAGTNWSIVTGNFSATNGVVHAQVPINAGASFFRLQQQ